MSENTKSARMVEFEEVFGHRLHGEPSESGGWTTWPTRTSPQTLAKFIDRAKRSGFRSAFCRDGIVGVLTEDVS